MAGKKPMPAQPKKKKPTTLLTGGSLKMGARESIPGSTGVVSTDSDSSDSEDRITLDERLKCQKVAGASFQMNPKAMYLSTSSGQRSPPPVQSTGTVQTPGATQDTISHAAPNPRPTEMTVGIASGSTAQNTAVQSEGGVDDAEADFGFGATFQESLR